MEIDFENIPMSILEEQHIEDYEELDFIFEEARLVGALEFFQIEYDSDKRIIRIPNELDTTEAIQTVELYLSYQDGEIATYTDRARQYDEFTADKRGADDGTFDYAGTFVLSILAIIEQFRIRK